MQSHTSTSRGDEVHKAVAAAVEVLVAPKDERLQSHGCNGSLWWHCAGHGRLEEVRGGGGGGMRIC